MRVQALEKSTRENHMSTMDLLGYVCLALGFAFVGGILAVVLAGPNGSRAGRSICCFLGGTLITFLLLLPDASQTQTWIWLSTFSAPVKVLLGVDALGEKVMLAFGASGAGLLSALILPAIWSGLRTSSALGWMGKWVIGPAILIGLLLAALHFGSKPEVELVVNLIGYIIGLGILFLVGKHFFKWWGGGGHGHAKK